MPFVIRKIPNQTKYKVYNKDTKKVHSYHTNRLHAMKQVELLHEIMGENIFVNTFHKVKNIADDISDKINITKKIINGRKTLSPKVENILKKVGNAQIIDIKIGRTVLPYHLTGLIKVFSDIPYDKLFHLFMILSTNKGEVLLEKNQVINMDLNPNIPKEAEYITIENIPNNVTINELINNTRKRMGEQKFFSYNAFKNNCQHFIENVLLSNNMNEGLDFIKQDTEDIFKNNPNLRKFANTLTDIAGRADVIKQGGEIDENKNNGLYSDQIEQILNKQGYNINGVYSKDKLPKELKNGWYVINLQSTNEGNRKGTHWTCFKYIDSGKTIEYFDAFGFAPPIEVMEKAKGDILYSEKEIQDTNATTCGWFCIGAIVSDKGYGTALTHFNKYINMFSTNTNINDRILSKYLTSKGIQ